MSAPGAIYTDGDYTIVMPCTLPVLSAPFPRVNVDYVLTQDFVQLETSYLSAPLNTPYPTSAGTGGVSGETWAGVDAYNTAGYILCSEGPRRDLGGGVVRWTRTYAIVPASHTQPGNISYNFIGFANSYLATVILRPRFTKTVPAQITYDYFLLTSSGSNALLELQQANYVQQQLYIQPRPDLISPLPEICLQVDYISDTDDPPSQPTLAQYGTWVLYGTQTIVAQDSVFTQWMGNIIQREIVTIYPQ